MVDILYGDITCWELCVCIYNLILAAVRTIIWPDLIFIRCILHTWKTRWKYSFFFSGSFAEMRFHLQWHNCMRNNRSQLQEDGGVIGMSGLYSQKRAWLAYQESHLDKSVNIAPHHILAFSIYRVSYLSLKFTIYDSVHSSMWKNEKKEEALVLRIWSPTFTM